MNAPKSGKSTKKFPYRKPADIEREIAQIEPEIRELEDLLGQPATWREPLKAVRFQDRHRDLKSKLERLYEHWEYATEAEW